MTWTQPVCEDRFFQIYGHRSVHVLNVPKDQWEPCCFCKKPTNIYIRVDPATVPYPRKDD